MKSMKWNENTKRRALAGGLTILGICLVIGISVQLKVSASKPAETLAVVETEESIAIIPETTAQETIEETTTVEATMETTPTEAESQETEALETEPVKKTAAAKPAAVQNIQPDITKPAPQADINDPAQMPDGTPVESAPVPVPHEEVVTPTEDEGQLQGGETNSSGQVYVPGFGWRTPTGGEGSYAADMYENGNKIGIMD